MHASPHAIADWRTEFEHVPHPPPLAAYQRIYNHERPHETIDWALPIDRYTRTPA